MYWNGDKLQGALGNLFGGKGKEVKNLVKAKNSDSTTSQAGGLFVEQGLVLVKLSREGFYKKVRFQR